MLFYFINFLTLTRVFGAPLLLLPWFFEGDLIWVFVTFLFIFLSLTDYFDGMLARKYNHVSNFGKFFDPIGDKIMVLFALVLLMVSKDLSPYFLLIFMSRDLIISGMRSFAASSGLVIAARDLGKYKATLQMIAIPLMLFPEFMIDLPLSPHFFGRIFLIVSVFLSILSAIDYFLGFRKLLVDTNNG